VVENCDSSLTQEGAVFVYAEYSTKNKARTLEFDKTLLICSTGQTQHRHKLRFSLKKKRY